MATVPRVLELTGSLVGEGEVVIEEKLFGADWTLKAPP